MAIGRDAIGTGFVTIARQRDMTETELRRASRREVLKLLPIGVLGAFLFGNPQRWLLNKGLAFSDEASGLAFRHGSRAQEFPDSQVAPFEKFPYNFWDVADPGIDLSAWRLRIEGLVQRAGAWWFLDLRTGNIESRNPIRHLSFRRGTCARWPERWRMSCGRC